jgi:DNA repair exonuclease SbcCD ATPase subunit
MIKKVKIHGLIDQRFEFELASSSPITFLYGVNGGGKSSILSCLYSFFLKLRLPRILIPFHFHLIQIVIIQ